MNDQNSSDFPKKEKVSTFLRKLKEEIGFTDILISTKDSESEITNLETKFHSKKFSAMCASVLRSAQDIGNAADDRNVDKIITRLEDKNIIIMNINENFFMILVCNENAKVKRFLDSKEKYLEKILSLL
jgi:predicted regulator of Ras-like GTPase activity (Roadblock/LC7/MglB family)